MRPVFRLYVYWSILWGLLALPFFGLAGILSYLLLVFDIFMMAVCGTYVVLNTHKMPSAAMRRLVGNSFLFMPILIGWGIFVTFFQGGQLFDAIVYLVVLQRAFMFLLAVFVYANKLCHISDSRASSMVRFDLKILFAVQSCIATLQIFYPDLGQMFIVNLTESQSSIFAFEEGNPSGTFPNSIELAFFFVAAYVGLSLPQWYRDRAPSLFGAIMVIVLVFWTGSLAAFCGIIVLAVFFHHRFIPRGSRVAFMFLAALAVLLPIFFYQTSLAVAVSAKAENMMLSRLGLLFLSLPDHAATAPLSLLSGLGADFELVREHLLAQPRVPLVLTYLGSAVVINDVFWLALVLSLGLPAAFLFILQFARVFRAYITYRTLPTARSLFHLLLFVIFFLGFFNQILIVRSFTSTLIYALLPFAITVGQTRARSC